MARHNVKLAEVIEEENEKNLSRIGNGKQTSSSIIAGCSVVTILPIPGRKVDYQPFVSILASAMATFFGSKVYNTTYLNRSRIDHYFYGIPSNTIATATAFEMTHNLIQQWAKGKIGVAARKSYSLGVAQGLMDLAWAESKKEMERVKQMEMMRMAEDERLTGPEGLKKTTQREEQKEEDGKKEERLKELEHSIDETMDDTELPPDILDADSDSASVYSDSEYEPDSSSDPDYTPNSKSIFKSNSKSKSDSNSVPWKSTQQLVLFRDNAKKVAENYLEMKGIKLRSGRKKDNTVRDKVAYAEGKEDSKKINVKAGRIKGTPEKSAKSGKEIMRV
jgi:hypothetical protein